MRTAAVVFASLCASAVALPCRLDLAAAGGSLAGAVNDVRLAGEECKSDPVSQTCATQLLSCQKGLGDAVVALDSSSRSCSNTTTACLEGISKAEAKANDAMFNIQNATAFCRASDKAACDRTIHDASFDIDEAVVALVDIRSSCSDNRRNLRVRGELQCKADVALGTADLAVLAKDLKSAVTDCTSNKTQECAEAVLATENELNSIADVMTKAATDCTGLSAACDTDITGAATAIHGAVTEIQKCQTDCKSGAEAACIADVTATLAQVSNAMLHLIKADSDCKKN